MDGSTIAMVSLSVHKHGSSFDLSASLPCSSLRPNLPEALYVRYCAHAVESWSAERQQPWLPLDFGAVQGNPGVDLTCSRLLSSTME